MNSWNESPVLWNDDDLEVFLDNIKQKVYALWESDYQIDADCTLTYVKDEEE